MPTVLWSGGLDSTCLLADIALRNKKDGIKEPVRAISVVNSQVPCQKQQKRAREKLKHWFDAFEYNIEVGEVNVKADAVPSADTLAYDVIDGHTIQPIIWLLGVIGLLRETEDLHVGYIRGDDIWHKKTELIKVFDNAQKITGRTGKLLFELEYETKADIIGLAKTYGFHDLCWWCEDANNESDTEQCGKCRSCQTYALGLHQYQTQKAANTVIGEPKDLLCPVLNECSEYKSPTQVKEEMGLAKNYTPDEGSSANSSGSK